MAAGLDPPEANRRMDPWRSSRRENQSATWRWKRRGSRLSPWTWTRRPLARPSRASAPRARVSAVLGPGRGSGSPPAGPAPAVGPLCRHLRDPAAPRPPARAPAEIGLAVGPSHQTGGEVTISVYAKNSLPELSQVEANSTLLNVHIVFEGKKEFHQNVELWGVIDGKRSYVTMTATEIEITMRKAEPMQWASLELPPAKKSEKPEDLTQ